MIYIRHLSDKAIQLGGQVATQQMLDDGWVEYHGEIPNSPSGAYEMINGALVPYTPPIDPYQQARNYVNYLESTDYKMLPDYEPKENEDLNIIKQKRKEARDFLRDSGQSLSVIRTIR